jgi:propionyl-CoA carboxylase alpha chain
VQRRHQKVVEEAPSSVLTPKLRKEMGECAVRVALACHYSGAGTVEFLLDENHNFYFLEMNTRLQVEHPVTEMITGKDLVKEQIRVARGEKLSFTQDELHINGHAIEIRVYAEDPENNFLPDIGTLNVYRLPQGNGVRVDGGFEEGMNIPIYYDPMLSKLIVHAANREEAIRGMIRAIDDYVIVGVKNTLAFCRFVMEHPAFTSGNFDTHFIRDHYQPVLLERKPSDDEIITAALFSAYHRVHTQAKQNPESTTQASVSNWKINRKGLS